MELSSCICLFSGLNFCAAFCLMPTNGCLIYFLCIFMLVYHGCLVWYQLFHHSPEAEIIIQNLNTKIMILALVRVIQKPYQLQKEQEGETELIYVIVAAGKS